MIAYILKSISLYHIAAREGIAMPGLAWVPFLRGWIMGSIADKHDEYHAKPDRKFRMFCLIIDILNILLALILFVIFIFVFSRLRSINLPSADFSTYDLSMLELQLFTVFGGLGLLAMLLIVAVGILAAAASVVEWVCRYKLFDLCRPSSVLSDLVISAVFPRLGYAIVLIINKNYRNDMDEMAMPRDYYGPVQ